MSAANWLQALAEDDALVEVEAVVVVVDAADAVELEEAELSDARSSTIACTSASSSAMRLLALDEEELEVDDVDDEAAAGGGPGGGPPCGPPTACEAELASELAPSSEIRFESSADICTGWEYSLADDELLADDADVEVDCDDVDALFASAVRAARRMSRICACWVVPETDRLMRKSFVG